MAQRTTVLLVDDLDGSDADESLEFGLDGVSYEIDLTDVHAASLRDALAPYIAHARRTGRSRGPATPARRRATSAPTSSSTAAGGREQNQAIRDWAARHGHPLSTRGRIPAAVSEAFHRGDPAALPATGASSSTTTPVAPSPASEKPTAGPSAATDELVDLASRPGRAHQRGARTHPGMGHRGRHRGQGPRPPQQGPRSATTAPSRPVASCLAARTVRLRIRERGLARTGAVVAAHAADLHDGGAVSGAHSRV